MKKMAKRFFSSVIVLAMLMALLPATVSQAATIDSRSFETETDIQNFTTGTYGSSAYEWDNTVAYNGQASMKAVQSSQYSCSGLSQQYEYGKTYRISARVKFDNPDNASKTVNFETWADQTVYNNTRMSWGGSLATDSLRVRSSTTTISDSEWHLLSREFTFTKLNEDAASKFSVIIGIETQGSTDTFWVDDFSIVEVLSVDENVKGEFIDVKTFEGVSTEVSGSTVTRTTDDAYEGRASAKITGTGTVMDIGTYDFEVGQYYRVTAYVKSDYQDGVTDENYIKFEMRNTSGTYTNVTSAKSRRDGYSGYRPGYSLGFPNDEQYATNGYGLSRFGGAPISAKDNGQWLRHERIFTVTSTDAAITTVPMKLSMWTNVPAGTILYVDAVKLEKLGIDGSHAAMSNYGGTIYNSGEGTTPDSGIATAYKFIAGANNDNHSPNMIFNVEAGKTYKASTKVYIPSSNKAEVEQVIADAAADETAYNKNLTPRIAFGGTKVDLVYDQWVNVSFDYTATETKAYRFGLDGINIGYYYGTGSYKTVKETFYFQGFDFEEVKSEAEAAGLPDISFDSGNWSSWGVALASDTTRLDGETAKQATKSVSYGIAYVKIPDLVVGEKYLAKAKFYLPKDAWVEGSKVKFFLIDNQAVKGESGFTDDPNYAMHKAIVDVTEDMTDKWIDVQLPFTHSQATTDTDGIYWINAVIDEISGTAKYYIADPKFVDANKAGIENLEIQANGTVTYTANAADYFLSYEYLDGTTVLASGMILAGEFLPKFDLADVEEPTVKLTAMNAYGVAEETVVGTKAVEETPDIGGDEEEGVFDVNSVTILDLEGDGVTGAQDISEISKGMYVDINYINSTEEAKQVWLMMAYYNADGLIEAKKYVVDLAVSADAKDEYYPAEPDDIPYVEGATVVKAFVWDIDGVEPLCEGYVVD